MPFAYYFERLTPNDLDYYKIVVGSPGILTVYTDWYSGVDPEGTLLASNCTPIDTDKDSGSNKLWTGGESDEPDS